uniref:Uncharacterized protein n=1 Tax=Tanacetum cinerariifolium TaxID=118510 RepID=A0A6L2LQL2_TANCI|nr:hypothetical protein [Tanacetum cinerariifolium]
MVNYLNSKEESTGLLETTFMEDVVLMGVFPDEGICSVNLILLLLFTGVIAISLVPKSLMQGQGPDMPLLANMLNQWEHAFVHAQQQEVSPPSPSPVVAPHPSPDPMPSPPRQSSPPPIPFVLETIISLIRDDDTGGGSFHESPPSHPPATPTRSPTEGVAEEPLTLTSLLALFPTCLQRIATLEAELKATKILHRDTVVLFAKRIMKLESKLKTKKRKLVLSDSDNEEEARQFQELDALLHLANAALHDPNPAKGKAVATPSSPVIAPTDKELADQQAAILKAKRQELLEQELKQSLDAEQVYLDSLLAQRVAKEQEKESRASANPTLSAKLLGADVSEDTFSVRMVELMNKRRKAISEMKAKAKIEKPMTPAQQKEFMRTFVKNQSSAIYSTGWTWKDVRGLTDDQLQIVYDKIQRAVDLATTRDHHQHLKRSGETLESSESKKLKSSHITEQPAELQETTSVSTGATIAAGDPIPAATSVSAASSIPVGTPIAAGVSTTAGASGSASEATVLIIELLDSPPTDTSIPLDPETEEQDVPLRKSSRKKSIAIWRTLLSPSKSKSATLLFDEDDPKAEFKKYLRQVSNDDEPVEPVSLALVSDIRRADLMVLYGMVSNKYKIERTTAGDIIYMFVDKMYLLTPETIQRMLNHGLEIDRDPAGNDLTTAIQLIQYLVNQLNHAA